MVTISVLAITRPTYLDVDQIAATTEKKMEAPQRGLAAMRAETISDNRAIVEDRVKSEAEKEFRQSLEQWRKAQAKAAQ